MTELKTDKSGFWAEKNKDAFLDYSLDWSDWLVSGDSIASSTWTADAALTLNTSAHNDTVTSIWVQGGLPNTWYALINTVTSAAGRVDQRIIRLFVTDELNTTTNGTAVFPNRVLTLETLRRDYLSMAGDTYLAGMNLEDDYLFSKLKAAESYAQKSLRCYLAPTVIIPDDAPQSEVDALEASGVRFVQEAAYDYDPSFFQGDKWGYIVTKQKPLISVQSIKFSYPSPLNQVFEIPHEWIRMDKKYGHIRMVPAAMSLSFPLSAFIMQAVSSGRAIPFMVHVRYTAGLPNIHDQYPEVVSVIKRLAVMNILKDAMVPQSGSISADGLSQSMSIDLDKYQSSIDEVLNTARESIHGIRVMAL